MTVSRTKMTELVTVWAVSLDGPNVPNLRYINALNNNVLGGLAVYMGMLWLADGDVLCVLNIICSAAVLACG